MVCPAVQIAVFCQILGGLIGVGVMWNVDRDEKLFLRDLAGMVEPCPPTSRTLQSSCSIAFWWTTLLGIWCSVFCPFEYCFPSILLNKFTLLQLRHVKLFKLVIALTSVVAARQTKYPVAMTRIGIRLVRHLWHLLISMKRFTAKVAWVGVYGKRSSFYDGDTINSPERNDVTQQLGANGLVV